MKVHHPGMARFDIAARCDWVETRGCGH
jgi:hypothetical protein